MPGTYDRKDHFYKQAKEQGFRSRAVFKLEEINKKHKLIKRGSKVLDLGAWPGGWLQFVEKVIGPEGCGVGIDMVAIEGFTSKNIKVIQGNADNEQNILEALALVGGKFDVVLSDMSPKLTGVKEVDNAAATALAELALRVACASLKTGGSLVIKLFKGNETEVFVKGAKPLFQRTAREELDSSRKTSNEYYLVGLGFKGASLPL